MSGAVRRYAPQAAFAAIALFFWASPLSFIPVPWPDDSAFFLPGIDWLKWPPAYRMHAQAPFVPSYDVANFNTMPLLPLLMGLESFADAEKEKAIKDGSFSVAIDDSEPKAS